MQRWKKLGHIFSTNGSQQWMNSHAAVPIAEHLSGDLFKIYFSSRNRNNQSFTGWIIINITKPQQIIELSKTPVLSPGELGGFDDSGAMATWLSKYNGKKYLYYIGWNLGVTVPFRNAIGLAVSQKNDEFKPYAKGPILDRTMTEPHFVASCCVIPGNDLWRMWYLSCTHWTSISNEVRHHYHIKYAESEDGINWKRDRIVAINFSDSSEYAISRPTVIRDKDCWRMWFSYRGEKYKIGYAESNDGKKWKRLDSQCELVRSQTGWDAEMVEYPFVFDHKGARYMLYNGNGYGETGFGLAVLEDA